VYFGCKNESYPIHNPSIDIPVPTLVSPSDRAVDQPLSINLHWVRLVGSPIYYVQVSIDSIFTMLTFQDSSFVDSIYFQWGLATTYYWRVKQRNINGVSPYSKSWCFTTIPNVPIAPLLISPPDSAINIPLEEPTFRWIRSIGASYYHIQVSFNKENLYNPDSWIYFNDSTITDTVKQFARKAMNSSLGARWYWRVRAKNVGGWGLWSDLWNFTVVPAVIPYHYPSPTLLFPVYVNNVPTTVTFRWKQASDSINSAKSYRLYLVSHGDTLTLIKYQIGIRDTTYTISGLEKDKSHYWRIDAYFRDSTYLAGGETYSEATFRTAP